MEWSRQRSGGDADPRIGAQVGNDNTDIPDRSTVDDGALAKVGIVTVLEALFAMANV
jgi:hypothetical protein